MNSNINKRFLVIKMSHCQSIGSNKCTPIVGDVDDRDGEEYLGARGDGNL